MYTLMVENSKGERLELTKNRSYTVIDVTGLSPAGVTINTSTVAGADGTRFNSAKINERNLVMTIKIDSPVENNRLELYKYFRQKEVTKVYYKNESRDVYIEGYVDAFEVLLFENYEKAQISLICPEPYFKAITDMVVDFSTLHDLFIFPFAIETDGIPISYVEINAEKSIVNHGDSDSGVIIELEATGPVKNPKLYNVDTLEAFGIVVDMVEGDKIVINTNQGHKGILMTSGGVTTNIINRRIKESSWFVLRQGDNVFTYEAEEGQINLSCRFIHTDKYEGV